MERIAERFAALSDAQRRALGRHAPHEDGGLGYPGDSPWWQARTAAWNAAIAAGLMGEWARICVRIEQAVGVVGRPPDSIGVELIDAIDIAEFAALAELLGARLADEHRQTLLAPWRAGSGQ